jgi:hypothetical protein
LGHYSDGLLKCHCCGYDNVVALSIDHINGGGTQHRKSLPSSSSTALYSWLKRSGYPKGYQVLCMNCQFVKREKNGECSR